MKPFNHPIIRISNVLWGGAAAALLGATLAEWQRQREEEAARLAALRNSGGGGGEEGDSDAADKKRMKVLARVNPAYASALAKEQSTRAAIAKVTAQELKGTNISVAQAQARQQAQWDANGQAIYAANQQFKETYGKEMDAATKEQAIKDATVNGVFNAGLYSVNLNTAQTKLEQAAEEQRRAEQAAMLEAQRQAAEEAARQNALEDFRAGEREVSMGQGKQESDKLDQIACTPENIQISKPWWQSFAFWASNNFGLAKSVEETASTSKTVIKTLDDGKISFSAPRSVRDIFDIKGTRYKPTTLTASSAAKGVFTSAAKNGTVLFNFGVSTFVNIYEYQWGDHKDKTVLSQEFAVSTVVDTIFSIAVGLVAAGLVAAVLAIAGVSAVVSTPALIAIGIATAITAIIIGLIVDVELEWPIQVKEMINHRINEIQGEIN